MLVSWDAEFVIELTCVTIAARHRSVDEMVAAVAKVAQFGSQGVPARGAALRVAHMCAGYEQIYSQLLRTALDSPRDSLLSR